MKEKLKFIALSLLLFVCFLIPPLTAQPSVDPDYMKSIAAYSLFTVAAFLCFFLRNRHAALISGFVIGAGFCALQPYMIYDALPVLLLCCWLRCYTEREQGNTVTAWFELFTDLIYAYLGAAAIRLIRSGYSFLKIFPNDIQAVPDLCLMAFVFLLFFILFLFHKSEKAKPSKKQKKPRAEKGIVGVIPVYTTLRTFWCFCALILVLCMLQYTNSKLIDETFLFLRSGFRMLFLPWIVLLLFAFRLLFQKTALRKRFFLADEKKLK